MKPLLNSVGFIFFILISGCQSGIDLKNIESKGLLGKLPGIKAEYIYRDSVLVVRSKTEAKSVDDIVKFQSEINKLKEDAEADFAAEAKNLGLPIIIPFIDSSDSYIVKDAKVVKAEWESITFSADVELRNNNRKTPAGRNPELMVPALLLDENNHILKFSKYDIWLMLAPSGESKTGKTLQFTGALPCNPAISDMKKVLFKSLIEYKKLKGWN